MNERIKEFAKDHFCRIEYDNGNLHECYEFSQDELEKFAELIVKETLQAARAGIEFGPSMEDAVYAYFGIK